MATAREVVRGARVIRARAGKSLRLSFSFVQRDSTGATVFVPVEDYTAHLQIRDTNNSRKVLLDVPETVSPTAPLSRYTDDEENTRFLIFLGKTYTSWLPESSLIECELISDNNPDDVVGLFSLILKMQPEGVTQ